MLHCFWKPQELVLLKLAPANKYNIIFFWCGNTNNTAETLITLQGLSPSLGGYCSPLYTQSTWPNYIPALNYPSGIRSVMWLPLSSERERSGELCLLRDYYVPGTVSQGICSSSLETFYLIFESSLLVIFLKATSKCSGLRSESPTTLLCAVLPTVSESTISHLDLSLELQTLKF